MGRAHFADEVSSVLNIREVHEVASERNLNWVKFYMEFADRLLEHKDDRRELVTKVRDVCNNLDFSYLDNSGTADSDEGLLDICPFTTIGAFNRDITVDNRKRIASEIASFLGVTEPVPESFDGIPTLNNQNSVVFWDSSDIDPLWQVFEDGIVLADADNEANRQSFLDSYDRIFQARGLGRKLTIGLFWARPTRFSPLDNSSERYISDNLGVPLSGPMPISGSEYLELVDQLQQRFSEADSPVHSFQELSLAAYDNPGNGGTSAVWLIRAGQNGEFEDAALQHGLAIVDWGAPDVTDAPSRDAIKELVRSADPDATESRIGSIASQLHSFRSEMQEGDVVVLPLKTQRPQVALGRITGPYKHGEIEGSWYHTRSVGWICRDVRPSDFGEDLQGSLQNRRTIHRMGGSEAVQQLEALLEGYKQSGGNAKKYWWVNQGSTHQHEVDGGYLWAPLQTKSGSVLAHHHHMADLKVGDRVFNYWAGRIQAISTITEEAVYSQIPAELANQDWQPEGRLARVDVGMLDDPVSLDDLPLEWRQEERGPFNRNGGVNQGYLYPVSQDFITKLSGRFPQLAQSVSIDCGVTGEPPTAYIEPDLETIRSRIESEGLVIDDRTLRRFHLSLRSRGFVILSGISGTGKTWLAQAYARAAEGRELLVPVAPNWTTNEDILGYLNPISGAYHDTLFSKFLREAALEWELSVAGKREPVPHYLVLDEMNLARVEYYFATFLSALEVRQRHETASVQLGEEAVLLTPNLRFVGTVNVDETTHGFADKVYDRAQLIELEAPREAIQRHLADSPLAEPLLAAWDALHEVAPFAFRVIDDIKNYVDAAKVLGVEVEAALDEQMLQKLLPKVHGIDPRIEQALTGFIEQCGDRFPLSSDKACRMRMRFYEHGSASYFA